MFVICQRCDFPCQGNMCLAFADADVQPQAVTELVLIDYALTIESRSQPSGKKPVEREIYTQPFRLAPVSGTALYASFAMHTGVRDISYVDDLEAFCFMLWHLGTGAHCWSPDMGDAASQATVKHKQTVRAYPYRVTHDRYRDPGCDLRAWFSISFIGRFCVTYRCMKHVQLLCSKS